MKTAPWPLESACSGHEACGETQIALPSGVEIGVQRGEPERNPLHVRQVDLPDAEEPRRRALEDDSADERRGHAEPDAPGQHIGADAAEDAREQRREVRREHRLPVSQMTGAANSAMPMMFSP